MTNEEVAKKLAAITGRPVGDFFNGEINATKTRREDDSETNHVHDIEKPEPTNPSRGTSSVEANKERVDEHQIEDISGELLEYQKMFKGSEIINGKILSGRQMTRKEYLKFKKTIDDIYSHPLAYKMFRSEGQREVKWPAWLDGFQKEKE